MDFPNIDQCWFLSFHSCNNFSAIYAVILPVTLASTARCRILRLLQFPIPQFPNDGGKGHRKTEVLAHFKVPILGPIIHCAVRNGLILVVSRYVCVPASHAPVEPRQDIAVAMSTTPSSPISNRIFINVEREQQFSVLHPGSDRNFWN